MKCDKGHQWEICDCPDEKIQPMLNFKTIAAFLVAAALGILLAAILVGK